MERRVYRHNSKLQLECGEAIENFEICYHISKEFPKEGEEMGEIIGSKKVIWITHALTANSDPTDWWDVLCGEGKLFDPRKYIIICANILGSCYGSTAPLSINPATGKPYLSDFPKITVRDTAVCHNILLSHLKLEKIDLLVGGSVGGFQGIEFSIMYPHKVKNLLMIASNCCTTPWIGAFNEAMRMAIMADPTPEKKNGLAAARAMALISYRSYKGYNTTQYEKDENFLFQTRVGSYQRYQGKKLTDRYDAYSYITMLNITDSHNVGRGRGGVEKALGLIKAKTVCLGITTDYIVPIEEQKFMAQHIPGAKFREITSEFGHDGFLLEWKQIKEVIEQEGLI